MQQAQKAFNNDEVIMDSSSRAARGSRCLKGFDSISIILNYFLNNDIFYVFLVLNSLMLVNRMAPLLN